MNYVTDLMAQHIFPMLSALDSSQKWSKVFDVKHPHIPLQKTDESGFRSSVMPSMWAQDMTNVEQLRGILESTIIRSPEAESLCEEVGAYAAERDALLLEISSANYIVQCYGLGEAVSCPHIDAPISSPNTRQFIDDVAVAIEMVAQFHPRIGNRVSQLLKTAVALLDVNDFAIHFALEPTASRINKPAASAVGSIDWSAFPYSAIIVPGFGPLDDKRSLSPRGRLQVQLASRHFQEGYAPMIIVSGGMVWPCHTRWRESEQLRQALIERFGIDETRIIVEPYARHTPANLRNAARMIISLGIPVDKKALIVTNDDQINHMLTPSFQSRCEQELGFVPGDLGSRVSDVALEFVPSTRSLIRNPMDPLDP